MPTSIHMPRNLLAAVDRRAEALRISRNRFIVRAVERAVARETEWSPGFFEFLRDIDPEDARAVDEMLEAVESRRSSKRALRL
jgi:predicted transcriptional regulator